MKPQKLKGFKDALPEEAEQRQRIIGCMQDVARIFGFQTIQTPTIEYAETLLGEGGETDKQVYRWQDTGEREVALRYDLTVPFARFAAEHLAQLPLPFKRLEIGQVFRAEKPQKGRFREFSQCDLDIIGTRSISADIEVISALASVLKNVEFGSFTFRLNHRAVLSGLIKFFLGEAGVSREAEVLIAIDKLEKIGLESMSKILQSIGNGEIFSEDKVNAFGQFLVSAQKDFGSVVERMQQEIFRDDEKALQGLSELIEIHAILSHLDFSQLATFKVDVSIARGLAYYTGLVFECLMDANQSIGSICSGGRYDNLAGRFTREPLPGVGGSLGLDRLVAGLVKQEDSGQNIFSDKVFIACASPDLRPHLFDLAYKIRKQQFVVDVFLGTNFKLGNQLRFANRLGFKHVVILGDEEVTAQVYTYKNMEHNTESKDLSFDQLMQQIQIS